MTPIGKIVTIFYAVIGVPLFLLYLSNIGQIFATSFKWTYSRLCKCQILRRRRYDETILKLRYKLLFYISGNIESTLFLNKFIQTFSLNFKNRTQIRYKNKGTFLIILNERLRYRKTQRLKFVFRHCIDYFF